MVHLNPSLSNYWKKGLSQYNYIIFQSFCWIWVFPLMFFLWNLIQDDSAFWVIFYSFLFYLSYIIVILFAVCCSLLGVSGLSLRYLTFLSEFFWFRCFIQSGDLFQFEFFKVVLLFYNFRACCFWLTLAKYL